MPSLQYKAPVVGSPAVVAPALHWSGPVPRRHEATTRTGVSPVALAGNHDRACLVHDISITACDCIRILCPVILIIDQLFPGDQVAMGQKF